MVDLKQQLREPNLHPVTMRTRLDWAADAIERLEAEVARLKSAIVAEIKEWQQTASGMAAEIERQRGYIKELDARDARMAAAMEKLRDNHKRAYDEGYAAAVHRSERLERIIAAIEERAAEREAEIAALQGQGTLAL